jgi:NAD(P)-dependent dehydrogenase (short-subunit alcohol dehydrogenase family)
MRLNLGTALALTQALLPGLRAQGWGRIINISSVSALGIVERTSYVAAKSALIGVTRTWALELASGRNRSFDLLIRSLERALLAAVDNCQPRECVLL